jgi:TolB-like protein
MIYRFGDRSLDTETCELRSGGAVVPVEPQVFALLRLLLENRGRLVARAEIVDRVWDGRIVSEAAISSRIKSARQVIGDDGRAQVLIRTVRKLGFRFVGHVEIARDASQPVCARVDALPEGASDSPLLEPSRPSIAVLPFSQVGPGASHAAIGDALAHDLIAELSRLRWLFVIARGSSFQFRGEAAVPERVGAALRVRYCLSGVIESAAGALAATVELADTRDGGVVWSERFQAPIEDVHEIRHGIARAVPSALDLQIPLHEARRAQLRSPDNLDAWASYHLALQQMYRFSREGNVRAVPLFERAIAQEPGFARAHAGLSFTHFENAFLGFAEARQATALARRHAETSLEHDPLDPLCNLVMGRTFWLEDDLEASLSWLDRAIRLNPNYAQGKYSRAWAETLLGEAMQGQADVDAALALSPLDPLAYGMLGVRAFSHLVLDQAAEAARWADRAARTPGAHALIEMIAAVAHALDGNEDRARAWASSARARSPGLRAPDFLRAFPFREPALRQRISQALARLEA